MFNTNINFSKVIRENVLSVLLTVRRLERIEVASTPFRMMYDEFKVLRADHLYRTRFNGGVQYLETALNDRFDPVSRGIYLENALYTKIYIYRKSELKPAKVLYKRWNSTTSFPTGSFCWYNNIIYVATAPALNKVPGVDPQWTATARQPAVLRKRANFYGGLSFRVRVPAALVYNANEMNSLIKYYKLAGPGYEIKPY
jgi:hypothetical protein